MRRNHQLLSILSAAALCVAMLPPVSVSAADQCDQGTQDGYDYELWNQDYKGFVKMDLLGNGAFSCEWNGIENCLFRTGKRLGSTKKYQDYGNIELEYEVDYHPDGNSYLCCYGWTQGPLVEYYIVEDWGTWRPPGAQSQGQVTIAGATYDLYKTTRVNCPSIEGNTTFEQYWSVRVPSDKTSSGTIHVADHFAAWEAQGWEMGRLYEVALNVEGYQSNGKATVKKNNLVLGGEKTPETPTEPPTEPADGFYMKEDFESGEGAWGPRGDGVKVANSASGTTGKGLAVTGRTDNWHGTAASLSNKVYIPGTAYSFSVMAKQDAAASDTLKLTLQYTLNGEDNYDTIAEAEAAKGKWVQLANTSYTIPTGATNMVLYVEADGKTNDFIIDDAMIAVKGTKIAATGSSTQTPDPTEPSAPGTPNTPDTGMVQKGDVNGDGNMDVKDVIALQKYLLGMKTTINGENSDMNSDNVIDIFDLGLLKNKLVAANTFTPPTQENPSYSGSYMEAVKASFTADVPADVRSKQAGVDYGKLEGISYFSTIANKEKKANVLLPPGYDSSKKYPVLYVNHGVFGDCQSMIDDGMGVIPLAGNLLAKGEAEPMIIVFTSMYTSKDSDQCAGITPEEMAKYDAFREDLIECLMPYINEHYSTKTGRENTAISGFSMGGRETLYIGVTKPEYFGYIGAACPAPGIVPAQDMFSMHPGNMQPNEFYVHGSVQPYMLFLAGGTNDTVVGTVPQEYNSLLTQNGQEHLWLEIQGGGHDGSVVVPMFYNFLRTVFKG